MCANLFNLQHDIAILEHGVMDGHFVPNIAIGLDVVNRFSEISKTPKELHLMVESPELFRDVFSLTQKIQKPVDIGVDGGVDLNRIRQLYKLGVNIFVAGTSTIFRNSNLKQNHRTY
jgi:ribulose-phosphate 3-epimerase